MQRNRGQSGGEKYIDLNVEVAWASGFTGKGVVVCILDDGVDHTHPDLVANYVSLRDLQITWKDTHALRHTNRNRKITRI